MLPDLRQPRRGDVLKVAIASSKARVLRTEYLLTSARSFRAEEGGVVSDVWSYWSL